MGFQIPVTGWVWVPGRSASQEETCLVYFRKTFHIDKMPAEHRIHISADSRYKLFVNSIFVCAGPVKGDNQIWFYDEIDLAPFLTTGENVIAVEVLRYPQNHNKGNHGVHRTETPGLYLQEAEEEKLGIATDHSWRCRVESEYEILPESLIFSPLYIFEKRHGNTELNGWREAGYQDDAWENASEYNILQMEKSISPGNLFPRPIPFLKLEQRTFCGLYGHFDASEDRKVWEAMMRGESAVRIPANRREFVEINAGELMTGYLSLRMNGGKAAEIRILTSEAYVSTDSPKEGFQPVPIKRDRCDWENGYLHGFSDYYTVAGAAPGEAEIYEPFWFRTFRFIRLEITTHDEPLEITGFDYRETGYPLEAKTVVETSDETLAPVWDISLRTLKRCMHETYEDCPYYEQLQYAMDSRSQILYTYAVSADDRLARKCMDDFRRSQRHDGMINCSYPCCRPNIIPGFSIYYIMMLHDHMMYFGDKDFLREHMSAVDGILEYFNRNLDPRGLVGKVGGLNVFDKYWSFIDWTTQWDATGGMPRAGLSGPITMESLLYIMGLEHAADVFGYLGREGMAAEYRSRAQNVRDAVNQYCTDENGMYLDGPGIPEYSQHCQVFAILSGTVTPEKGRAYLQKTLDRPDDYAQCSVAMAYYLFRAMEKTGLYAQIDKKWDLWRDMIKKNLTTCVEDGVNERSDCHAWGALVLYELPVVVLGVKPAAPGYEKVEISPNPGYFTWAKGDIITSKGIVSVSWKLDGEDHLEITYQVPEGMEAEVRV